MRLTTKLVFTFAVVFVLGLPGEILAQVNTANFLGIVRDPTGALIPGAEVTLTNEGTGDVRTRISGDTGEFIFDTLAVGAYTLQIQMPGFKTFVQKGIRLSAGQTVRQSFALEIGEVSEQLTIEAGAPLVSTATPEQRETITSTKVIELPLGRRNLTNLLRLSTGVDIAGGGARGLRINGVGKSGSGISVDGTDANANPEGRGGIATYQSTNYFDVMSIDAVAEVQIMRGILPADTGEVLGGQINVISKSGTNAYHGSLFHNYQSHVFSARAPFNVNRNKDGSLTPKPRLVFNQFGGTAGGPILQDKAFFFFAYEGYRESLFQQVRGTFPTQKLRDEIKKAYAGVKEMDILLSTMPLPDVIFDEDRGEFQDNRNRRSRENHFIVKGDWLVTPGSTLSVTYTRNRPFHLRPRAFIGIGNDRFWENKSDRLTFQYIAGSADWTSETRFGYGKIFQRRLDQFFEAFDPANQTEKVFSGRRLPNFGVSGLSLSDPQGELYIQDAPSYSLEQKVSHHLGRHTFKFGGRYSYLGGFRNNPDKPDLQL